MDLDWFLEEDQFAYNYELEGRLHAISHGTGRTRCGHAGNKKRKEQMRKVYDRPLGPTRGCRIKPHIDIAS